ncbi:MAG TPA: nuclear transport factor 2 family protein, partial [Kofleriaceae bacterium]|nr:nuclear transport factor 2 family protein [Kofleriaceae bacterium]
AAPPSAPPAPPPKPAAEPPGRAEQPVVPAVAPSNAAPTPGARTDAAAASGAGVAIAADPPSDETRVIKPRQSVDHMLAAQRAAIANADSNALSALLSTRAFAFGVDADEVAEGRDAIAAQLTRDLGEVPPGGLTVESKALTVGQERGHAWIAEELDITTPGRERRRLAITELAAAIDGQWLIVAMHWASPVDDATAERLAILKTMPTPHPIADRREGADELETAVRAAFASRATFTDALSERPDAFNFGSGGERVRGGYAIKRIFGRLRAQIRMHDGARVIAGSFWDPSQKTAPWIGWAAVNVDFTSKTRAATEITQTFRVLAVLLKDGADWKIVQTQWSNGGPVR